MREILFRGKRLDNGEWVYGDLFNHYDGSAEIFKHKETIFAGKKLEGRWYFVDSKTISQYTGEEDRGGKKIFEMDIVEFPWSIGTERDRVIFRDGRFTLNHFWWASVLDKKVEVIGNIYDNPELLESGGDSN